MLKIGQVADRSALSTETIRYYERQGLLPKPERGDNGYRYFSEDAVQRLRFIRKAKALGFSLAEIHELLNLSMDSHTTAKEIKANASAKLHDIEEKITNLSRMRSALIELIDQCPGQGPKEYCPIFNALNDS